MTETPPGALPGQAVDRGTQDFDDSYLGTPPWDIGRPQPIFEALLDEGVIAGRVLDAGCGTGEHALMAADRGLDVTGIDASPRAIQLAQRKASERGVSALFLVHDALALADLSGRFDTVLDSGLFHVFDDERRSRYVDQLTRVMSPGGRLLLACFSDGEPGDWGPRRISEAEIRQTFAGPWTVESLERATFYTTLDPPTVKAWAARIAFTG